MSKPDYVYRQKFLTKCSREIGKNILDEYADNVVSLCKSMFSEYFFQPDGESVMTDLKCVALSDKAWRWYLYVKTGEETSRYYIDSIYNPESLCRISYSQEAIGEYLRPYELDDTPETVLKRLESRDQPLFNVDAYPQITKINFFYSTTRYIDMCVRLNQKIINNTTSFILKDKLRETGLTEEGSSILSAEVVYEKEYVIPFCEVCTTKDWLVQVAGSGLTLCSECFHLEIKKGHHVFPALGLPSQYLHFTGR